MQELNARFIFLNERVIEMFSINIIIIFYNMLFFLNNCVIFKWISGGQQIRCLKEKIKNFYFIEKQDG